MIWIGRLIDAQISQNISYSGGIAAPISDTPTLFGTLGLNTSGAGANLRVQFSATVAISTTVAAIIPITIEIYRGVGPGRVLIYSATETAPAVGSVGVLSRQIITVTGADNLPPSTAGLIYQAYVSIPGGITTAPTRTGPECFNASAYSD